MTVTYHTYSIQFQSSTALLRICGAKCDERKGQGALKPKWGTEANREAEGHIAPLASRFSSDVAVLVSHSHHDSSGKGVAHHGLYGGDRGFGSTPAYSSRQCLCTKK
jgi:hypothetical protein